MASWLVTGSNRGIGLGLVREALSRGHEVIAAARDPGAAELMGLASRHPALSTVAMDVTSDASVAAAAERFRGQPIDVLINNAGSYGPKQQGAFDVDLDGFLATLAVNTVAPFRVLRAFRANLTAAAPSAKVVTISSSMGAFSGTGTGTLAYRASKAGVNKAVQAVAGELLGHGVISIVMHPGWVRTDMGGPAATLSVAEATTAIVRAIDRLTAKNAGQFLNYDGSPLTW